jgi:hypothetical protein
MNNFAALLDRGKYTNFFRSGYFCGYSAAIFENIRLLNSLRLLQKCCNLLRSKSEFNSLFYFINHNFSLSFMTEAMKNYSRVNNSIAAVTPRRAKSANPFDATPPVEIHQTVIEHRIVIPETPVGLIGEKVTYSEKYLKKCKGEPSFPMPECGYFTITKAVMREDCSVMIALHPLPNWYYSHLDGTHICLSNMAKISI